MSEETRRGFLKHVLGGIAVLATPSFAQEPIKSNELETKVRTLISDKKFDDAIALAQSEKGYEKLEAECHKEYAVHLKAIAIKGLPNGQLKELETITDKAIQEYTLAFKDETLFKTAEHRAERASLFVGRKRYDEAIDDYSYVAITFPKSVSGYAGIIDTKLRKGESDSISQIFIELDKKNPGTLDASTLLRGSGAGVQYWFNHIKRHGGKIEHGKETLALFTRMSELFMRSWMNKGKTEDGELKSVSERFSAAHRSEALFCTYVAGAAAYAGQPFELALSEYDAVVIPRYERMKEHVEGNLLESDKFAQQMLKNLEFRNKDVFLGQLARRAKK